MPQTPSTITRLIECLGKQRDCYTLILGVLRRQRKAIEEENEDALAKAMQDKNPLLLKMQELDEVLKPLMQNITEAEWEQTVKKSKALKDEITETLRQIIAEEDACALLLNKKRDDTFEQIKILNQSKKGLSSYKETDGSKPPRFSQEG